MKRTLLLVVLASLVIGAVAIDRADAGFWYGRYWGLDARTVWCQTTIWQTVWTGYWGGYSPYYYGGYNWPGGGGWYHSYSGYYHTRPWWYWGGPSWYYGFTDYYTYRATFTWPRTIYTWSRYWDPDNKGFTMDFYTEVDAAEGAVAVLPADISGVGEKRIDEVIEVGDHHWSYNGGEQEGVFTELAWIGASPDAVMAYLALQGFDAQTIDEILAEEILMDVFASNFDGLDYGDGLIGVQWCSYDIPEPLTITLLGLGSLAVLRRRRS